MKLSAQCRDFRAFIARENNLVFLIIVCSNRRGLRVHRCYGIAVEGNKLESLDRSAYLDFSDEIDIEVLMEGLQSFGNWLSRKFEVGRAKIGYIGEMMIKHAAYMLCKERGGLVKCLKECHIVTRKGTIGWKAVYQMFVNSKDLPKEPSEVNLWSGQLPSPCMQLIASA